MSEHDGAPGAPAGSQADVSAPTPSGPAPTPRSEALPEEVQRTQDGLRFVHALLGTAGLERQDVRATVAALTDLMVQKGWISEAELEAAREPIHRQLAAATIGAFALDPATDDKYATPPELLDCSERLAGCRAACCHRSLALGRQEVEERWLRWDPAYPYWLLQRDDGSCYHLDPETLRCRAYAHRPGACRRYSCRHDPGVWSDFEGRVPAGGADGSLTE